MENEFTSLGNLISRIRQITFWGRLFNWKSIKSGLVDAYADFQKIGIMLDSALSRISELKAENNNLSKDYINARDNATNLAADISNNKTIIQALNDKINSLIADLSAKESLTESQKDRINQLTSDGALLRQKNEQLISENKNISGDVASIRESLSKTMERRNELESELDKLKINYQHLLDERNTLSEQNTQFISEAETRRQKYENDIAVLNSIKDQLQSDRNKEMEDRHQLEIQRLENMKQTWIKHQDSVKQAIKVISNKHAISYLDTVPFKGEPDNTLKISDEYIIFDAKSPKTDDLGNFASYLQKQAEDAKKYAKQENIKRWIFFVIPSNTYEVVKTFVYNLADYDVFIITLNSLEPIILSLQKIEEYDFTDQLSPDERENICRVLGKFAHLTKRRIQVDYYFIKQFIELAYKAESDLPATILEDAKEFEKQEKLNPPMEKRAKAISIVDLEKDALKVKNEANNQGIIVHDETLNEIGKLPLYIDKEVE